MSELFEPPRRTKHEAISALLSAHPRRRFVLVGDSSESDAEIFAELAAEQPRARPPRILAIFIRRVDSMCAALVSTVAVCLCGCTHELTRGVTHTGGWANNSHERFRSAFARVRSDTLCAAFTRPADVDTLLRKHLQLLEYNQAPVPLQRGLPLDQQPQVPVAT